MLVQFARWNVLSIPEPKPTGPLPPANRIPRSTGGGGFEALRFDGFQQRLVFNGCGMGKCHCLPFAKGLKQLWKKLDKARASVPSETRVKLEHIQIS